LVQIEQGITLQSWCVGTEANRSTKVISQTNIHGPTIPGQGEFESLLPLLLLLLLLLS
jgi:hypothetical protein